MSKKEPMSHKETDNYIGVPSTSKLQSTKTTFDTTLEVIKNAKVKQYKGKRDPTSADFRQSSVKLQVMDAKFIKSYQEYVEDKDCYDDVDEIIDLDTTISTLETEHLTSRSISTTSDPSESRKKYSKKRNHDQQLMESVLETIDRRNPCMTMLDRVLFWKVSNDLEIQSDLNDELNPLKDQTNDLASLKSVNHFKQLKASSSGESSIKLRYNYFLKPQQSQQQQQEHQESVFKKPISPVEQPACSVDSTQNRSATETVDNDIAIINDDNDGNEDSSKEEFYKYLGIDTNPSLHQRQEKNDENAKRRSLRVKVQQIAMHNIAKYNKEHEVDKTKSITNEISPKLNAVNVKIKKLVIDLGETSNAEDINSSKSDQTVKLKNVPNQMEHLDEQIETSFEHLNNGKMNCLNTPEKSISNEKPILWNKNKKSKDAALLANGKIIVNQPIIIVENINATRELLKRKNNKVTPDAIATETVKMSEAIGNDLKVKKQHDEDPPKNNKLNKNVNSSTNDLQTNLCDKATNNVDNVKSSDQQSNKNEQQTDVQSVQVITSDKEPTKKSTLIKCTYINVPDTVVIPKSSAYKTMVLLNQSKPLPVVQPAYSIPPLLPKPKVFSCLERHDYKIAEPINTHSEQKSYTAKVLSSSLNKSSGSISSKTSSRHVPQPSKSETEVSQLLPVSTDTVKTKANRKPIPLTLAEQNTAMQQLNALQEAAVAAAPEELQKNPLKSAILIKHQNLLSRALRNVRYGLRGSSLIKNAKNNKRLRKIRNNSAPTKASDDKCTNLEPVDGQISNETTTDSDLENLLSINDRIMESTKRSIDIDVSDIGLTKKGKFNDLSLTSPKIMLNKDDAISLNLRLSTSDKPKELITGNTSPLIDVFDETLHSNTPTASPMSTRLTSPPLQAIRAISIDDPAVLFEPHILPTASVQLSSIPKTRAALANSITNPLKMESSPVLAILYRNEIIIIVQELEISFWKHPSQLYNIFAMRQQWELIGRTDRQNSDFEIETPYQSRLCCNEENPAYIELRAKQNDPTESRECWITSVYLNVYYFDQNEQQLMLQHVDLDKICGMARSIRYTILPNSRYFIMTWTEEAANRTRCGVCKYSLSPDLDTLASIRELPFLQHSIKSLSCFKDNKLLGFGQSIVTMWDHTTCDLLLNIDIDLPIGENLGCFLLNENDEKYLFLTQSFDGNQQANCLKLMAINLSDCFTWKVIQSHEIPSSFKSVASSSMHADCLTVTYENGESLLFSLNNPKIIHLRASAAAAAKSNDELFKLFVQNDKIFHLTREHLIIKTINEYFLETNT